MTDIHYELTTDIKCIVQFIPKERDNIDLSDQNMCVLIGVITAQDIVSAARQQKPNCTNEELVKSLNFYIINDAFYDFKLD